MRFCGNQIPRFFRVPPRSAQRAESTGGLGALAAVHSLDPLCASTSALRSTAGQGQDFVTQTSGSGCFALVDLMGQTDLPRCGRDASRCSPSGTGLDVAIILILKIEKKDRGGSVSGCLGAGRDGLRRQARCRSALRLKPGSCGVGGRTNEAQDTGRVFVSAFPAPGHHQLMTRVFCE